MSSPVIPNEILGKFGFLNDVFTTKPQKENFWMFFLGITASDKTTVNGFANWFDGWKNQSSLNRFISESNWNASYLLRQYDYFLKQLPVSKKQQDYAIIDDSKEKSGTEIDCVFRGYDSNEKRYLWCHNFVVLLLKLAGALLPFRAEIYKKDSGISKLDLAEEMIDQILNIRKPMFLFVKPV